jgi:glycosyltransferase involved in cell wall biosynthesis
MPNTAYAPPGITAHEQPEAIDPLAPGSMELPVKLAGSMLRSLGVDTMRPSCFQTRPFDTWQDPHAVIDAWSELQGVQLVLAGRDRESWPQLREISDYADHHEDLILLKGMGDVELNALRLIARAGLESSLARGSELSRLETFWKGTPVVDADAERLAELIADPGLAIELGAEGQQRVRERHLITHLAENELALLASFQSA